MTENKSLKMSFDPHTIEHLGVKMYANLPNAIAELIANAYDADAMNVQIKLFDEAGEKRIEVADDGYGMSFEEVNDKFLRIGRNRRESGDKRSPSGKRKVTGKKGLGKLAFFGIGNTIEITTTKKNSGQKIIFTLDWDELISTKERDYTPRHDIKKCGKDEQGTTIALFELKRKSAFDKDGMALSISKLFNCLDKNFKVSISLNGDKETLITNKLKYDAIVSQFEWKFPDFCIDIDVNYAERGSIVGKIYSTEKPLRPGYRGITLYANGRLVNASEFFGVLESSHGFSYFTGWLDVNFVDDWEKDVIATDRQSLNWDLPKTSELREFLKKTMLKLEKSWREKRNTERRANIKKKLKVDVGKWYAHLPEEIRTNIEPIIDMVVEKSELTDSEQEKAVQSLYSLVPEYPEFHWRHLHSEVQDAAKEVYEKAEYYSAFSEAVKRYIHRTKSMGGSTNPSESTLMREVFGPNQKLSVVKKYKKPDGTEFEAQTKENIEVGQRELSYGIVMGGRHPVAHEEVVDLRDSGLFTEKDCLDALSLLSHLFRRLADAEKN